MSSPSTLRGFEKPAPYLVVRDFLGVDLVNRLLAHAEASQDSFTPTAIDKGQVDPEIRISRVLREFGPLRDELKLRFRAVLDETVAQLRLSPFELERLELELAAHGDGAFYRRHIDTQIARAERATERVLTGVFYFHTLPKAYDGGALRLHSILPPEQGGRFRDIVPEQDMLVLFPSWAPHEVLPVSCPSGAFMASRFAINCWYRRRRAS